MGGSEGADVIKRLEATYLGDKRTVRLFSDGSHGVFDVRGINGYIGPDCFFQAEELSELYADHSQSP